jgi:hypothetical protein
MTKEMANIVKVFFRVCVSKMAKEITNIVKFFLELVYQRAIRKNTFTILAISLFLFDTLTLKRLLQYW